MDQPSIYKSPEGDAAIMRWYDEQVSRLPVPVESCRVHTSFGATHLLVSGPKTAPPLVILHGMNMNAAAMHAAITHFSASRRVYAVDIIGMPGKSAGVRPARNGNGYPTWLCETIDAQGIARADFLGQSFGGWLILKLAAHSPRRIRRAALMSSGGFAPFTVRGQLVAGAVALRYLIWPNARNRRRAAQPFYASGATPDPRFATLLGLSYQHARMDINIRGLPVLSGEDLSEFNAPTFVCYGERDIFFDAHRAVQRAREILGDSVVTEVVEGEGHLFTDEAEKKLYRRVGSFLENPAR